MLIFRMPQIYIRKTTLQLWSKGNMTKAIDAIFNMGWLKVLKIFEIQQATPRRKLVSQIKLHRVELEK